MKSLLFYIRYTLGQLAQLSNPVADAAVVGLALKLDPSIHLSTADFTGILVGVGLLSRYVLGQLNALASNAKAAYAAKKATSK